KIFAANKIASSIFLYPVHLQILPLIAFFTSSIDGFGLESINAFAHIIIPGVQKPHCTAPALAKAYEYTFCSLSLNPSIVIIFLPSNFLSLCTHAFTALPSIIKVHVPQAPCEQPSLTECMCKSSRKNLR